MDKNELKIYLIFILCGLGDTVTTYIGLISGGGIETRLFGTIPFLSTLLFSSAYYTIHRLHGPNELKNILCICMIIIAFSGFANNFAGLLGIENFTLIK